MFYHILLANFKEMAPIIYTPTVGWACLNYHKLFRRPRGMFFSKRGDASLPPLATCSLLPAVFQ